MNDVEEIVRKMDRRDGFSVVSYREVGLPVFRVKSLLTLEETGKLGAIEEFVMRSIQLGIDSCDDISSFLGLQRKLVASQIVQSASEWSIAQNADDLSRYSLTSKGRNLIAQAKATRIEKDQIPLYVDGITRDVVSLESRDMWSGTQLADLGISMLSPTPRHSPKPAEIDLVGINRMFQLVASADRPTRRAIRLDAVLGRTSVYFRRAVAVAFKSTDGKKIDIGFAINGRESSDHEVAFARTNDPKKSLVFGALFDADKRRRDVQAVAREVRGDVPGLSDVVRSNGRPVPIRVKGAGAAPAGSSKVRVLSVYDHPPLLRRAFESAKVRVLLVSPWIRANVVDGDFIRRLTECLSRGVEVTIAYGIGKKDAGERVKDMEARESLEALTKSFSNFRLVRKGNTHAKVLLVDSDYFVTTSFNWLSFAGDPKQPMREEEGTLVQGGSEVSEYYDRLMDRMSHHEE